MDIIVAQGTEAGGHSGEIATMVLVPEVVDAVGGRPVLAAGGIGNGRQVAAALALGAQGVWTGSMWLNTVECGQPELMYKKFHEAGSQDAVRSRAYTGKPARQLRTEWTDAWDDPSTPAPLGMPLQFMLCAEAQDRIRRAGKEELMGTPDRPARRLLHRGADRRRGHRQPQDGVRPGRQLPAPPVHPRPRLSWRPPP